MTVDSGTTPVGGGAALPTAPEPQAPLRADGVQLIGEMAGSGYRNPPSLVRRSDGQTIQLTRLLYLVLEEVDGERDAAAIASRVSDSFDRPVSPDNVAALLDKLRTLGLLVRADGQQPEVKRSNPLLALRFKYAVTDPERTRRLTDPFARLFHPLVLLPLLAAFGFICWWVLFRKGLASATYQAFDHPGLLLLVFVVTVLSAGFHEFGHAAGARYGGATPGVMGAGVYLMWPAFYTDVTDSYRLGRGGRLRTDLGGLYFNAIVAVAVAGIWWVSGYDALLLVIATQILQMIRQLTPLVRFDGYHVLADLTGVPDLFHRIKPTLLGLLPWRWGDPAAKALKPWARAVVSLWVLVVVPTLLFTILMMVLALPRILATAWVKLGENQQFLSAGWARGDLVEVAARVLAMAAVALPILGTFYVLTRLVRRGSTSVWRRTAGHPYRRALSGVTAAALVAGLLWVWWPDGNTYRPIQPYERGTLMDAVAAARPVTGGLQAGQQGSVQALWDRNDPLPTRDQPQLALVLVPHSTSGAPSPDAKTGWVFPFDKPLAPGEGDNQAFATNTTDGTVKYDVAFALVWVDGGEAALNTNEAYAFTSCEHCASVAVGFQVVLVVGDNHVAVPQNLSGAVNFDCVNCLSYALAKQLFVTIPGPLSDAAMNDLDLLWAKIQDFGAHIDEVPLSEIASTLADYEVQILAIIAEDQPGVLPSASTSASQSPSGSASSGASASGTSSASPSGGASSDPSGTTSPSGSGGTSPSPTATASGASPSADATSPAASPTASPTG